MPPLKRPPTYDSSQLPALPWVPDQELVQTLIRHGMPGRDALAAVNNFGLRFFATSFYFDVRDAEKGNKDAKERVDYCRHIWNEQAKERKGS